MTVWSDPEDFGLVPLGSFDYGPQDYCFNIFAVWQHKETGRLYYAVDCGCSCPAPFEDYHSLDDLTVISRPDLFKEMKSGAYQPLHESDNAERLQLMEKILLG